MSLTGCGQNQPLQKSNQDSNLPKVIEVRKPEPTCKPVEPNKYFPNIVKRLDFATKKKTVESFKNLLDAYRYNTDKLLILINEVNNYNKCNGR